MPAIGLMVGFFDNYFIQDDDFSKLFVMIACSVSALYGDAYLLDWQRAFMIGYAVAKGSALGL